MEATHSVHSLAPDIGRNIFPQPVVPVPLLLVANVDPMVGQQVFDVAQARRKTDVHHHLQRDDLSKEAGSETG